MFFFTSSPAEELEFVLEDGVKEPCDTIILKNTLPYSIAYKVTKFIIILMCCLKTYSYNIVMQIIYPKRLIVTYYIFYLCVHNI